MSIDTMVICPKCGGIPMPLSFPDGCDLCLGFGQVQVSSLFDFVIDQMEGQTADEWLAGLNDGSTVSPDVLRIIEQL